MISKRHRIYFTVCNDKKKVLNGVKVYVNQEISFTDIGLGLFTYVNISLEDKGDVEDFNFKISDSGSGNYRG